MHDVIIYACKVANQRVHACTHILVFVIIAVSAQNYDIANTGIFKRGGGGNQAPHTMSLVIDLIGQKVWIIIIMVT